MSFGTHIFILLGVYLDVGSLSHGIGMPLVIGSTDKQAIVTLLALI